MGYCKAGIFSPYLVLKPLSGLGDGSRRNAQKEGLLGHGKLKAGENEQADIALCEVRVFLPEGFWGERETVSEHPFQFDPFAVLNISGIGVKFLQQMVLACKGMHEEIGTHITFWPGSFGGHEGFTLITSGADDHQKGPHILADDFGCLGNSQRSVAFHAGMGQPKTDQKQLVIKHFSVFAMKIEGLGYGSK